MARKSAWRARALLLWYCLYYLCEFISNILFAWRIMELGCPRSNLWVKVGEWFHFESCLVKRGIIYSRRGTFKKKTVYTSDLYVCVCERVMGGGGCVSALWALILRFAQKFLKGYRMMQLDRSPAPLLDWCPTYGRIPTNEWQVTDDVTGFILHTTRASRFLFILSQTSIGMSYAHTREPH